MVKVDKLSKIYDRGPCSKATVAIEQLSFGIGRGDCLTFLGVNGAGKSTTFKILTGEIKPTKGDVQIAGYDVAKGFDRVKLLIGYCPQ
jgi:ATP-binding cassette subfamily A (ABC1) protein 3